MNKELLEQELGQGRVQENKNISPYLTLRTKTIAEYYFEAETREDIIKAYNLTRKLNIPFLILGGGSNVAVTKDILKGLVVRNLYQKKEVIEDQRETVDLLVSSGYSIARLVTETASEGLEGFEYHLGLPGSLGGAVAMNSKWYVDRRPVYIGDPLIKAYLLDKKGDVKEVDKEYFKFAYDYSVLRDTHEVLLEGVFRLNKNDPAVLKKRAQAAMQFRKETQVTGQPTCGCMFQNLTEEEQKSHNLPTTSVGYLIDKAGLKNTQIGNFVVSNEHANFIINKGEGKPEDLHSLIHLIKSKIKKMYGIDLKEEVVII